MYIMPKRDFDGIFYRKLKNNDEIARDQDKLGVQNRAKENVFRLSQLLAVNRSP